MELQPQDIKQWLLHANQTFQENKGYLTSLDQAIGDGDHGINMARGFQEVEKKLESTEYTNVGDVLKDTAMTLMSKVGGASGPLFGTAFLKLSTNLKGQDNADFKGFAEGITAAAEGLKQRGKAEKGEKTMVDVWQPMSEFLQAQADFSGDDIETEAKKAMETTKDMSAKKGRAAYLGERSVGHLDPGSVSSYYLFSALAEVINKGA
ncbi:dihydroxyacetone kinase subunit DhaL [Virgibacillus senegalensis]|uniref:dihydroxyacetone kinase subunit DhaL n=1 Tax=Virgibacillus senegalensis TaxID=1499679 RepID=UPI00069EF370|nr:dihydroxyacetone kinase subunit DhaL [Virgibacillus senegalensis]